MSQVSQFLISLILMNNYCVFKVLSQTNYREGLIPDTVIDKYIYMFCYHTGLRFEYLPNNFIGIE